MRSRPTYDVVVVGARAAGAATAFLCARLGLRVLLVDRTKYGSDTLSTHALMRGGVMQLRRWGVLDAVIAAGTPPVRRTTFRYADDVVALQVKPSYGVDALYAPRRTVLDPILVDAAVAAGVDVRFGVAVADVLWGDGRVAGVIGRTRTGDAFSTRARIVVGADGIRSTVADRVGAPFERLGMAASSVTYGYWPGLDMDGYEWNFTPDAASGVIPTNDGHACVFVSAPQRHIRRGGLAVLRRIVARSSPELAARLDAAQPPPALRTFTGRPAHLRRSWGPGWALVGDAGYFKDPLSAHGLTDALRDAELLTRAIAAVVVAGAAEHHALAYYQAQRDELSRDLFDVTDVLASHRWTDAEIPGLLLRLTTSMSDELQTLAALPSWTPASVAVGGGANPAPASASHR